jgi:hypothetical protein
VPTSLARSASLGASLQIRRDHQCRSGDRLRPQVDAIRHRTSYVRDLKTLACSTESFPKISRKDRLEAPMI